MSLEIQFRYELVCTPKGCEFTDSSNDFTRKNLFDEGEKVIYLFNGTYSVNQLESLGQTLSINKKFFAIWFFLIFSMVFGTTL